MFDNTDVSGIFRGVDVDLSSFLMSQLKTPIGIVPEGILRASDTIWLHFPDITSLQKCHEENTVTEWAGQDTSVDYQFGSSSRKQKLKKTCKQY
ncbi:Uncharacterized protein GBIM_05852, partial [Gryllus bimaculatus]